MALIESYKRQKMELIPIPTINFNDFQLNSYSNSPGVEILDLTKLGAELVKLFQQAGFCYIKNHGIDAKLIKNYFDLSRDFFNQPVDQKQRYYRKDNDKQFGWVSGNAENKTSDQPTGNRESFTFYPRHDVGDWDEKLKEFQKISLEMVNQCTKLAHRILEALALGLELDSDFFINTHRLIGREGNYSCLKSLYYPKIPEDTNIQPGQIRLREHTDYGSLTLLFQDEIDGLEVMVPGKGFVPAAPKPDTVVVNIGDMLQRWTADKLPAVKHRVVVPKRELVMRSSRQSVAFFVHADDTCKITCIDGSDRYGPITAMENMERILN